MKSLQKLKVHLFILCFFFTSMSALAAYDFIEGGIYYKMTSISPNKVEVAAGPTKYVGAINIPSIVTNSSVTYAVTGIGDNAFQACTGLTSVVIPTSVIKINANAFNGCTSLPAITIPSGVPAIEDNTFNGCTILNSVSIPNTVTNIKMYAFKNCTALTSISIPVGVTTIGNEAFSYSGLSSISFPGSVATIGNLALAYCANLTTIAFPSALTSIGDMVIFESNNVNSITSFKTTPPTCLASTTFFRMGGVTCTLHVRAGSSTAYKAANGWSEFTATTVEDAVLSVSETGLDGVQISIQQGQLVILNAPVGKIITVYALQGTPINNKVAISETVDVNLPTRGVYVVKIGNQSVKIVF